MSEISPVRLNLLRAGYLLIVVGLGSSVWPSVLDLGNEWERSRGVVIAMLGSFSLLSLLGLRHPLRMLPLFFWEIAWKAIWLLRVALPAWAGDTLDAATAQTAIECLASVVLVAVMPWDHIFRVYVKGPGERWRRAGPSPRSPLPS